MRASGTLHDEHMHLRPHGVSPLPPHRLEPLLAACAERGVVPGIREHAPLPRRYRLGPDEDYLFAMREDEVGAFFEEFRGKGVAVGFEVDHIGGCEAETREIVSGLFERARDLGVPRGGLTGSVHFIPGTVADLPPGIDKGGVPHILCDYLESVMTAHVAEHGAARTVCDYFDAVQTMVRTGLYDVVGHLELIRKWDRAGPDGKSVLFGEVEELYAERLEATIRLAAEADMILEYNTSGRDIVIGRPYLSDEAVRACVRHGAKIALSSDTHLPKHAGRYFEDAARTLRKLGVRHVYAARQGERIETAL